MFENSFSKKNAFLPYGSSEPFCETSRSLGSADHHRVLQTSLQLCPLFPVRAFFAKQDLDLFFEKVGKKVWCGVLSFLLWMSVLVPYSQLHKISSFLSSLSRPLNSSAPTLLHSWLFLLFQLCQRCQPWILFCPVAPTNFHVLFSLLLLMDRIPSLSQFMRPLLSTIIQIIIKKNIDLNSPWTCLGSS